MPPPPFDTPVPPGPPRPLRWTVEQFHHLGQFKFFEGRRPMLLDGIIYEEGTEPPPHGCARSLVVNALYHLPDCHLRQRMPLVLGPATDPVPDVAAVPGGPRAYSAAHPTAAVLVVEVADFSAAFDTTTKADAYAAAGVADYWVVDLTTRMLIVFRDPSAGYRTRLTFGPADRVAPLASPNSPVAVADLLP